jgi:uncharacterized protein (DUF697 family)
MESSAQIQKELDKAISARAAGQSSYTYKGIKYDLTGLNETVIPLIQSSLKVAQEREGESAQAAKRAKVVSDREKRATRTALARAKTLLKTAQSTQRAQVSRFSSGQITADEYSAYVNKVAEYQAVVDAINGGAQAIAVGANEVRVLSPEAPPPTGAAVPTAVKGTTASTATTGTQTNVPATTTPKVTTTPTGTTVAAKGKAKKEPVATQQNWVDALQQFFPSYSDDWLAANAETYFGKDLIDLMIRVSDPKGVYDLTTSAGLERIQQEIRGTNYWQTTISATKNFDQLIDADKQNLITQTKSRIANTYGDIGLTEDTLSQVAATVARTGLTGLGEKQAVYNAVFKATTNQAQTGRALSGVDADRIKQLGKAYNFNVTDSQVQSILTGTPEVSTGVVLTEEGLRQRLQKYVKGAMPQIADQIDAGLTLEDIGGNYRRYAAQLLERSEDEIDMFSGPYLKAFGTKESGQLSLGDWVTTVKSDPTFGWQFTKAANQQATDIGLTLARAFGKVS